MGFKKKNLVAKIKFSANYQIICIYVLLKEADLIRLSLQYSSKRNFQAYKSNQRCSGALFLWAGEPARDDQGVKQGNWFFNLPVPFSTKRNGRGKRKCLNDIKAQRAKVYK